MIIHCYLYKLNNTVNIEHVKKTLTTMKDFIPEIQKLEIGINFAYAENSFDLAQISYFKNKADFETFNRHSYHAKMREYMKQNIVQSIKVDFETNI